MPGKMRQISTSNGCLSFRSLDSGLRPTATEISLLAPPNFPFGEDQDSSGISLVLILRMLRCLNRNSFKIEAVKIGCRGLIALKSRRRNVDGRFSQRLATPSRLWEPQATPLQTNRGHDGFSAATRINPSAYTISD